MAAQTNTLQVLRDLESVQHGVQCIQECFIRGMAAIAELERLDGELARLRERGFLIGDAALESLSVVDVYESMGGVAIGQYGEAMMALQLLDSSRRLVKQACREINP